MLSAKNKKKEKYYKQIIPYNISLTKVGQLAVLQIIASFLFL